VDEMTYISVELFKPIWILASLQLEHGV